MCPSFPRRTAPLATSSRAVGKALCSASLILSHKLSSVSSTNTGTASCTMMAPASTSSCTETLKEVSIKVNLICMFSSLWSHGEIQQELDYNVLFRWVWGKFWILELPPPTWRGHCNLTLVATQVAVFPHVHCKHENEGLYLQRQSGLCSQQLSPLPGEPVSEHSHPWMRAAEMGGCSAAFLKDKTLIKTVQ